MRSTSLVFSVVFSLACGATQDLPDTPESIVREMPTPARIIDLRNGSEIDEIQMLADLRSARAVYLGERHDVPLDHAMQYRIIRALYREDASLVIGFEMFQKPFQGVLDDWTNGMLDEEALRRRSEWDERWGFDIRMYRPVLELVRSRAIPAWALNAPRELTRAVALQGIEGLSEEMRADLPENMDLDDEEHQNLVRSALAAHPHGNDPNALARLYEAQVTWDEVMGAQVGEAIRNGASRIIVLAGQMHVKAGLGIPKRAARRGAQPYTVVIAVEDDDELIEAIKNEEPRPADFLWVHDD